MTLKAVCQWLNTSQPTMYRWMARPDGPPVRKLGRRLLFNRDEIQHWVLTQPGFNLPSNPQM